MKHKVERFDNLMYNGCEPHWHCIHCNGYWPFHCYSKAALEEMECPSQKQPELKDCPFCGHTAILNSYKARKGFEANVQCSNCTASIISITYDSEKEAIEAVTKDWNRRA